MIQTSIEQLQAEIEQGQRLLEYGLLAMLLLVGLLLGWLIGYFQGVKEGRSQEIAAAERYGPRSFSRGNG
jgi:hypothetical protein